MFHTGRQNNIAARSRDNCPLAAAYDDLAIEQEEAVVKISMNMAGRRSPRRDRQLNDSRRSRRAIRIAKHREGAEEPPRASPARFGRNRPFGTCIVPSVQLIVSDRHDRSVWLMMS